ncbi:MAG TPA: cytidine deaminase [Saprospiraceae bacterium]|nr:cytidine deaminase [Saprospiraceae bacterium]
MKEEKKFEFSYSYYSHQDELTGAEQELIKRSISEAENAYAPYSGFHVGAAGIVSGNEIVGASNMENAAYPQCLCAEQVLCAAVKSQFNDQPITGMAVYSPNWKNHLPLSPCGSCRQILVEKERRQNVNLVLFLLSASGEIWKIPSALSLLPFGFQ